MVMRLLDRMHSCLEAQQTKCITFAAIFEASPENYTHFSMGPRHQPRHVILRGIIITLNMSFER